jgi:hypothetical protein
LAEAVRLPDGIAPPWRLSASSAVTSLKHEGIAFNLRTLTVVDSASIALDAIERIEKQACRLFEVCRLSDVPVITFVT